jgi:endonuclease-3
VIEAVIGTILFQNTSSKSCTRAKKGLDQAFGRNNFEAIAKARQERVVDVIRTGDIANKKANMIQKLLRTVRERYGVYSLQHLAGENCPPAEVPVALRDDEIMEELLSYYGVGPKTASCVLLFCLRRDSFPVDTHIYRLSRLLGWIPAKADRVLGQAHLDVRTPANLKYALHVLMIQHGRVCRECKRSDSGENCVLEKLFEGEEN